MIQSFPLKKWFRSRYSENVSSSYKESMEEYQKISHQTYIHSILSKSGKLYLFNLFSIMKQSGYDVTINDLKLLFSQVTQNDYLTRDDFNRCFNNQSIDKIVKIIINKTKKQEILHACTFQALVDHLCFLKERQQILKATNDQEYDKLLKLLIHSPTNLPQISKTEKKQNSQIHSYSPQQGSENFFVTQSKPKKVKLKLKKSLNEIIKKSKQEVQVQISKLQSDSSIITQQKINQSSIDKSIQVNIFKQKRDFKDSYPYDASLDYLNSSILIKRKNYKNFNQIFKQPMILDTKVQLLCEKDEKDGNELIKKFTTKKENLRNHQLKRFLKQIKKK